ncbi:HNH endonuclease [Haloglomus salinum]|uniref:HNH endonuclease n=1 Tax=Haloglomus salinum TaxID=2962673 RepID=UPI0020C98294|nr:HNH endonuclease [Haloglomus salinum]
MSEADAPWRDAATLERLYWGEGLSLDGIADRLGCSDVTVLNWMEKHDIERRTQKSERLPRPLTVTSPGSTNQGYELVWHDDHCVRHHRLLAVAEYGLSSIRDCEVHHRNGVHWDNRPENLALVGPSEHGRIHSPERSGDSHEPTTRRATTVCPDCEERFLSVGTHWNRTECDPPTPSPSIRKLVDGLVLGDGHVRFPGSQRPGYLQVRMTNSRFVAWLDRQFGGISTGARLNRKATDHRCAVHSIRTRSLPWLDRYHDWYRNGRTIVPETYTLTPVAAMVWYVSDGSLSWGDGVSLRLYCADYVDHAPVRVRSLFESHGFHPTVEPYGLRFPKVEHQELLDWLGPAPPGFAYKWAIDSRERYRRLQP